MLQTRRRKMITSSPLWWPVCCVLLMYTGANAEHAARLKCIADTHLSTYKSEVTNARGASSGIKIKHRENFPLLKFDTSPIPENATIKTASLFLHLKKDDPDYFLNHVSVSTVPTDWVEGDHNASGKHSMACLLWPGPQTKKWGWQDDRDILGSIFGNGGNVTCVDIAENKGDKWWELPLNPRLVDALRKDQPGGIALHDEMISRVGGPANIYFDSREQSGGKYAAYITVTYTVEDKIPPSRPEISGSKPGPYPGSVVVDIICGGDNGKQGTALGLDIKAVQRQSSKSYILPRYMIPRPVKSGSVITALFENLDPGTEYTFAVTSYDEAGNRSEPVESRVVTACPETPKELKGFESINVIKGAPLRIGPVKVYAVDGLIKVQPVTGRIIGGAEDSSKGNYIYNGSNKTINIFGAKGEILSVNLVIELADRARKAEIAVRPGALTDAQDNTISADSFRLYRVTYAKEKFGEVVPPDPGPYEIPAKNPAVKGQKNQVVAIDLYIPHNAEPGNYDGALTLQSGGITGELPVNLTVYPVEIPEHISFHVELNAYGQRSKEQFYAIHRLAHLHRLGYNVLSYSHSGNTTMPVVPVIEGKGVLATVRDWEPWDSWMAPLLDGSLFNDMPRKGVPIPHFYLPFYENWPMKLQEHYTNQEIANRPPRPDNEEQKAAFNKWKMEFARKAPLIEHAFDNVWVEGNKAVAKEFRQHFEQNGWTGTEFQFFLNNKFYKGNLSYWLLDEPAAGHSFRALAYIYKIQSEQFIGSDVVVSCRADVSRPNYQGDRLDDAPFLLLNMSGGYHQYTPLCRRFIVRRGFRTWLYGGGTGVESDNTGLDAYIIKSWVMGADGCMPYWTSFSGSNRWTDGSSLRHVYPGNRHGYRQKVVGSLRMFAMRRGQMDCELLNLLAKKPGWDRWIAGRSVMKYLDIGGQLESRGADDPGRVSFKGLRPAQFAALRRAILEELSQ